VLSLKFNKEMVEVPVAPDMIAPGPEMPVYSLKDGVAYLRIPNFSAMGDTGTVTPEGRERLEEVQRHIRMLDKGDTVIIDLRSNPGGYTDTSSLVPAILFKRQFANFVPEMAELFSPGTTQARLQNIWDRGDDSDGYRNIRKAAQLEADKQKKNPVRRWELQSFRGEAAKPVENSRKVIILINRGSASASEMLCAIRTIPNVTIIGENSAGIHTFGAGQLYVLPNSQAPVLLPDMIVIDTSFSAGEGTGVLPEQLIYQPGH
jgi:C-terminal processing protease CtpA/Prc